ncbi:hypothetical protein BC834DRAFT_926055 [Gloeopeniophorella convolvens]|nr:hypothetical protein BC834DRAFT_926055 [Gloeopeniophorella convolvens]
MPHKRAKRTVRDQQRKEKSRPAGGTSTEAIPKSVARVLDAARKRARQQEGEEGGDAPAKRRRVADAAEGAKAGSAAIAKSKVKIQPGESLKHFNRRVEDDMRPLMRSAIKTSAATERKGKKPAAGAKDQQPDATGKKSKMQSSEDAEDAAAPADKHRDRPKEFATTSSAAPRRLNDVAMAPPELKRLRAARRSGVLSMAQRAMMETEREKAIQRYREMKERKARGSGRTLGGDDGAGD